MASGIDSGAHPTYCDVRLDPSRRTIALRQPLVLDLGAVAKGLAVDLAARELRPLADFAVDAWGDLYLSGHSRAGGPWRVGTCHPRREGALADVLRLSGAGVCTSGDYERRSASGGHHLVAPRTGGAPDGPASVTVVAPTAVLADALATAAFVLAASGPDRALSLLRRQGVEGLILIGPRSPASPAAPLERHETPGFVRHRR